ncbi:3-oxoacyl-ACP synthase [Mycolicibacterium flavescens]|uniref:3-oxoacyl-ACP synthase n=1 Tax=Mycolicibacterium flavescens TaxID=1776 RepID=A0A1E3R8G8_MYCFV|nr:3-oxoacyl-ACP synthase [Mycolicibacterium flavescens]MCV7282613.1 3-oxoacyl-ACP synthase [Mycolicibacterium flavescens]ODQ86099.1 3-oxoacyl-ACP synthase [Mycolicibacterium flavescens]
MGTVVDQISVVEAGWRDRHSALRLADRAARDCLRAAGRPADEVDLLVNVGIYRDRNLGEPALASMIQHDIGANPEPPPTGTHGTFSFDVANGSCGPLTALQIVDGFLGAGVIDCALVVAADADPGRRCSESFPYSPTGSALLCTWHEDARGLGPVAWERSPDNRRLVSATIAMAGDHNVLRVAETASAASELAYVAAGAARRCLGAAATPLDRIDAVVAAPAGQEYRTELAAQLNVPVDLITVADDPRQHTASFASALTKALAATSVGEQVLVVAAGAGFSAGAALYRR